MEDYTDGQSFEVGDRVEIHPRFDFWMRGDRYGDIVELRDHPTSDTRYAVKLDKSGRSAWFAAQDLRFV